MPGSIVLSGGGSGASSAAVQAGINQATDIDTLILLSTQIRDAVQLLAVGGLQPIPTLQPTISGTPGQSINAPQIPPPGPGRAVVIQIIAWYDSSAANGRVLLTGSDGVTYLDTPIANRSGLSIKIKLRENLGGQISLTAGGATISGRINYATATESA
jgi:hypothetical protein